MRIFVKKLTEDEVAVEVRTRARLIRRIARRLSDKKLFLLKWRHLMGRIEIKDREEENAALEVELDEETER